MKKYYLAVLIAIAVSASVLSSCKSGCVKGSGNIVAENRKVAEFNKLDISGGFKIILKQDSTLAVTINADDNVLKYIKTEVGDNKLHISTDSRGICSSGPPIVTIGVRNLAAIKASGAVEVSSEGTLTAGDMQFNLTGATNINMGLNAANVSIEGHGVTEITLRGQASSNSIDLSGGGKIHAFDFVVGNYNISTTGASECEINVLHDLNVNSTGASSIKYKGNPANIHNDKAGASSITKVN